MLVSATVIYPIMVEIEVPDDISPEDATELILQEADRIMETSGSSPIVHECSHPVL